MRYVKTALKVAAETVLVSTVGSLFWIALGQQYISTQGTSWEFASNSETFWAGFLSIVQIYFLYRVVQWLIGLIAKKTAKTVDNSLQDVKAYSNMRDRVMNVFVQDKPVPPPAERQPMSSNDPERCHSCGVLHGRIHLSGCQRHAP